MVDSSQNPYATPPRAAAADVRTYQGFTGRGLPSTVQQVRVVSILQMVVGALELLVSAILAVYAGILGAMSTGAIEVPEGEEEALFVFGIISAVMLFFGSAILMPPCSASGRELPASNSNDARWRSLHPFWE